MAGPTMTLTQKAEQAVPSFHIPSNWRDYRSPVPDKRFIPNSPVYGFGAPPRVDHNHPHWVCSCGRVHDAAIHVCDNCGKRHDWGDMSGGADLEYSKMVQLPQYVLDSMENDGPLSAAYKINPHITGIRPKIPAPATGQYPYRYDARKYENMFVIKNHEEIQGYVQASIEADAGSGISKDDLADLNLGHRADRLVYMCVSGWALMMWRTEEDFLRGQYGGRNCPRPIGWWDLRKAHDVAVEKGESELDKCPHRVAVLTSGGVVYFRVPYEEDVHIWYNGIRGMIRDWNYQWIQSRDTKHHQQKRWACACGLAECLSRGLPIGERAMASAFHCYDMDYNCQLQVGEIMILIEEVEAGIRHKMGIAEAADRDLAVESGMSKFEGGINEIFERAMTFRNTCDKDGNGIVRKDEFILYGQQLLSEALGFHGIPSSGGHIAASKNDVCSIM